MAMTVRRRRLLQLGVAAGAVAATGGVALATGAGTEEAGKTLPSDLELPKRFAVPLPIPPVAEPVSTDGEADRYEFTQRPAKVEIIPGTTTQVWGYDGQFPGPTLAVRRGRPVSVTVTNELDVPTSTHLHGGVTPADSDGFPTDVIVPKGGGFTPASHTHMHIDESTWRFHDGSREYLYPFDQAAATLWYHDHRMDFTAPQVWRGLAGFCIIGDDVDDALPLPKGERDVPLMLCDRSFNQDGSFKYPAVDGTLLGEPGVTAEFHQGVQGDVLLVNGAPWPVMDVAAAKYRFRFLNAGNARRFNLALDPAPDTAAFVQVGSDLGLLASPQELDELAIAPAERYDVIIDFSAYSPGTEVTLINTIGEAETGEVMRFRVGEDTDDETSVPETLTEFDTLNADQVVGDRTFRFEMSHHFGQDLWTINEEPYDPAGSLATVELDSVEKWIFTSDFHHPVHVHLGHFQVLSRNGKPPNDNDGGWKDTVDLRPFETVEVLIRFSSHKGRYMMHCHNLEHEDMAMMANFDVV